jgi:membrane protein DedA with SNARE-associated domain
MVFFDAGAERLAEEMLPFLERFDRAAARPTRRTLDFEMASDDPLPTRLNLDRSISPWTQLAVLAGATFVSEDLTCISAGLLARAGSIDPFVAVLGSFLGIFVSDIWLWGMGRWIGRRVLRWRWVARRVPAAGVDRFGESFDRHIGKAVIASRFLPGTRLPMYVGAGIVSKRPFAFIGWLAVAAAIWTPILVLAAMTFGPVAARPFEMIFGVGWPSWIAAALLLLGLMRIVALSLTWRGRVRLRVGLARIRRWEFWPLWLFYLPVLPWIGWLALRHGGLTTPTATNPGQPHGGVVGESKSEILAGLPAEAVQPSFRVDPGPAASRVAVLRAHLERQGWSFPLVLKPDEGQRGAGLKLARGWSDVEAYLERDPRAVLVQAYHPGPLEAGIFYYRMPGEQRGRIFSITDKSFPEVTGDGSSTLEELILRHPRLRMQWKIFATRMAERWSSVPEEGERVRLAVAGNHCQGTMFLDGERLISPALERSIDAVARECDGFYFGRFDVRYGTEQALRDGHGYRFLELNGVTSESTDIYDPDNSLWAAYRTLFRQWRIAFEIGAANRRAGHRASSIPELIRAARAHYRNRPPNSAAD